LVKFSGVQHREIAAVSFPKLSPLVVVCYCVGTERRPLIDRII